MWLPQSRGMNPKAPYEIWVGDGPRIKMKAELLIAQKEPIPVFLKQRTNQWLYVGWWELTHSRQRETYCPRSRKRRSDP